MPPVRIFYNFFYPRFIRLIRTLSEHFDVHVFTAANRLYLDFFLRILDPEQKYIKRTLCRGDFKDKNDKKDISQVVGHKDPCEVIVFDDKPVSFFRKFTFSFFDKS